MTGDLPATRGGAWSRLRQLFTHNQQQIEAIELFEGTREAGAQPLAVCRVGDQVVVTGTVRTLTLVPRTDLPAVEAEIYDGTDKLRAIWMGRRRIRGIDPGRMITLTGRLTKVDGRLTMFNPRYELRPGVHG